MYCHKKRYVRLCWFVVTREKPVNAHSNEYLWLDQVMEQGRADGCPCAELLYKVGCQCEITRVQ